MDRQPPPLRSHLMWKAELPRHREFQSNRGPPGLVFDLCPGFSDMEPAPGLMALNEAGSPPTNSLFLRDGSTRALPGRCGAAIDAGLRSSLTSVVPSRDTSG
jgi:hypothetical protein